MGYVLITGASSGLGAEFARQLGAYGHHLVLVARDVHRLTSLADELSSRHQIDVEVVAADLLTEDGVERVTDRLKNTSSPVTTLINNAGFGLPGWFGDSTIEAEQDQLRILVEVPMRLSYAALQVMPHGSRILNVASTAGFTPRGTYGAAKAWVISFSRWANVHYAPRVHTTAVCPGFVRTEFHERLGADVSGIPSWMWLDSARVVREALSDAAKDRGVSIPSKRFKALTALSRILPDKAATRLAGRGR
ncbi:MAG: SDR family NAD(P)-dependent oxidoreductase [Acidobacteria bacterium]|nr:SDR family NAD(P)-dependent oxidoreductase [Acidobacteriota bacterium]